MVEILNSVQAKQVEKITGVKVKASDILLQLSEGNTKLSKVDGIEFLIWNITADYSDLLQMRICNNSTIKCRQLCYAKKAQKMYPSVQNRRHKNLLISLDSKKFIGAMIEEIEYKLNSKKYKGKLVFFRIHESGEFFSYEYLKAFIAITNYFKGNNNIVFLAYTKELQLVEKAFNEFGRENINITFKSSIWEDTSIENIELTKKLNLSVFTALKKEEIKQSKYLKCPADKNIGCGECKLCYIKELNTAIEIH